MTKRKVVEEISVSSEEIISEKTEKTEKEKLLELYQTLKDLNVRSISDLENLIARAE